MDYTSRLTSFVVVAGLALAVCTAQADDKATDKSARSNNDTFPTTRKQLSANDMIGRKVINTQNEDLGKIHDLVINVDAGSVPYAIISSGFAGRSKVAVPLESLQCSADGKTFTLDASKEAFKTAAKSPPDRWVVVESAEWTRGVDGYYGQPSPMRDRYERQRYGDTNDSRVYTRDPNTIKGGERLMQPADRAICEKVCDAIDNVQVDVDNGVATLNGTVESEATRQSIEAKVRAVPGVQRVESHLKVKNP